MSEPLPELHQAVLDGPTLDALFADLAACTEVLDVQAKGSATAYAHDAAGLGAVREALLSGSVHAAQIRYRWRGEIWWDTLLRVPGGVRIVRRCAPQL